MDAGLDIRPGVEADLRALNDVYDHYVRATHVTFDLEPISIEDRRAWFEDHALTGSHRLFVACADDRLVGFATSSPYAARRGYDTSVQTSVHLAPDVTGRGIGTALYRTLFEAIAPQDLHRAYAGVALPNDGSLALHPRFGFEQVAHFTQQGPKFGRFWALCPSSAPSGEDQPGGDARSGRPLAPCRVSKLRPRGARWRGGRWAQRGAGCARAAVIAAAASSAGEPLSPDTSVTLAYPARTTPRSVSASGSRIWPS